MPPKRQASIKGFFTPSGNSGRQDVSSPAASSAGPATPLASDSETSTPRRGRATQAASQASSSRVRYQRQARTPSVESEGEEGLNNIRFSPERARWRPTTKRIVADDEDQSDQVVREVVNLATSSEDDEPAQNTSRLKRNASSSSSVSASPSAPRRKRKERAPPRRASRSSARAASASSVVVLCDSDDSSSAAPSPPATRLRRRSETQTQRRIRHIRGKRAGASQSETEEERGEQSDSFIVDDDEVPRIRREIRNARTTEGLSKKKRRLDPDDEDTADADTAEEDEHDLEMDEPERFKTSTRLRQRIETPHQRLLRKLHNKRNNIVSSGSEEEDDEEADVTVDDGPVVIDDSEGFITDDGGEFDDSLMPAEFSRGYAQSMEYKFKVFFQYLILLTIHGPGILPLKGEQKEYMKPAQELRAYFKGIRNGRVRGQIWKPEFVAALEKYPTFLVYDLAEKEPYCDACNRRNQHCWCGVDLKGTPYDHETHGEVTSAVGSTDGSDEDEKDDDDDESDSGDDNEKAIEPGHDEEGLLIRFNMGPHCLVSSRLYHSLSHWEHELYRRVRQHYHDLLRAKDVPVSDSSDASSGSERDDDLDSDTAAERQVDRQNRSEWRRRNMQRRAARVQKLRGKPNLPREGDVNAVTEWMEEQGYQNKAFQTFTDLENRARGLGGGGRGGDSGGE